MRKFLVQLMGKIQWESLRKLFTGRKYNLTEQDHGRIFSAIKNQPYIILTYRKAHLSTWLVRAAELILNQKWGCYGHVLVAFQRGLPVCKYSDIRFVEAIGKGVVDSHWSDVFNVDGVCVLRPIYFDSATLLKQIPEIENDIGKKYDSKLNPYDDNQMACVEVGREIMKHIPGYEKSMRVFESMIARRKYLTPDMFKDCPDFEVVLEIKK